MVCIHREFHLCLRYPFPGGLCGAHGPLRFQSIAKGRLDGLVILYPVGSSVFIR